MTKHITISVTPDREAIYEQLLNRDKTGLGLSGMLGIAAQEYVESDKGICNVPTIHSSPADLREYARTCDTPDYKNFQMHSIIVSNILREEDQRRI